MTFNTTQVALWVNGAQFRKQQTEKTIPFHVSSNSSTGDGHFVFCSWNRCHGVVSWWTFPISFDFQSKVFHNGLRGSSRFGSVRIIGLESGNLIFAVRTQSGFASLVYCTNTRSLRLWRKATVLFNQPSKYLFASFGRVCVSRDKAINQVQIRLNTTCDRKCSSVGEKKKLFRFLFSSVLHFN